MQIKNVKVAFLEESIIKSGYPMQTGEPEDLDTKIFVNFSDEGNTFEVSDLDEKRAKKLAKTPVGSGHNNFLKGIIVQFDMKYPQYWTPQLQRYHWFELISSQSKMHCITKIDKLSEHCNKFTLKNIMLERLDWLIEVYNKGGFNQYPYECDDVIFNTKEDIFQTIISSLPMGYEMWMGISTNYLQLKTIYNQRKNHKLQEWKEFCQWIKTLPMANELIINENTDNS